MCCGISSQRCARDGVCRRGRRAVMVERRPVLRRRAERTRARVAHLGPGSASAAAVATSGFMHPELVEERPPRWAPLAHAGQHHLLDVGGRSDRMDAQTVGHLAGHAAHDGLTAARWMGYRGVVAPGLNSGTVVDVVMQPGRRAARRSAGVPDRPQRLDVFTHPGAGGATTRRTGARYGRAPAGLGPSVKRPFESFWIVQALIAITVGLRGKAMATDVASFSRPVAWAASAMMTKGSSLVSSTTMP